MARNKKDVELSLARVNLKDLAEMSKRFTGRDPTPQEYAEAKLHLESFNRKVEAHLAAQKQKK